MRIAIYKHDYGWGTEKWWRKFLMSFLMFFREYDRVVRGGDLKRSVREAMLAGAGVVNFSKVLGKRQRVELVGLLREEGYGYFHFAKGRNLEVMRDVELLLVTREESEVFFKPEFGEGPDLQFGGGTLGVHLKEANVYVFCVDFPLKRNEEYMKQLSLLQKEVQKVSGRVVLLGNMKQEDFEGFVKLDDGFLAQGFSKVESSGQVQGGAEEPLRWVEL